jgi:hypothetical protein
MLLRRAQAEALDVNAGRLWIVTPQTGHREGYGLTTVCCHSLLIPAISIGCVDHPGTFQ